MHAWTRPTERKMVEMQRRRPRQPLVLRLTVEGTGETGNGASPPDQLELETTLPTGEIAQWLDDLWWIDVLRRWQNRSLALHILPTPYALLHPVVIHQLEMLHRVAPDWRRVGIAYLDDVATDDDIARLARSPYEEVRIIDAARPDALKQPAELRGLSFQALLGRVMRLQAAARINQPILVRIPPETLRSADFASAEVSEAIYTST